LALIRLIAPTTDERRLLTTVEAAEGFVYLISRLGVTGPKTTIGTSLQGTVAQIRSVTPLPIAIGFGIATGEQAREAAMLGDGVVVGSALVQRLSQGIGPARDLMQELAAGLKHGQVD
jgi:tryptophan synthase alpha chain